MRKSHTFCRRGPFEIAGQRNTDCCGEAATIQRIALHDNHWPSETWTGPRRSGQICPPDFALGNYHSLRSRTRRAAEETNSSFAAPSSEQALFIASVTLSGVCRASPPFQPTPKKPHPHLFF